MKLFVIGATGRTGREVIEQALARGDHVTAFVRSPESITLRNERLTVLKGNAIDENQLSDAMQDHDAVLSTLGPREVFKPSSLLHDSALATTRAMRRSGVKRFVVLSAAAHFPGIPNRIAASTSHSGTIYDVSKQGGCCSQDGFHSVPESSCHIHARRD